jgi:hypothetical protein
LKVRDFVSLTLFRGALCFREPQMPPLATSRWKQSLNIL